MTIDEIKQAFHKADLILRPWIVFASPSDAKAIKEALPRIEEKVIIQETEAIESGKAIAIEREKLEAWMPLPETWRGGGRMNHDYAHCLDQTENCPKNCFRRQLNEDLKTMKNYGMGWISWMHFRGTGMCQIEEEEE